MRAFRTVYPEKTVILLRDAFFWVWKGQNWCDRISCNVIRYWKSAATALTSSINETLKAEKLCVRTNPPNWIIVLNGLPTWYAAWREWKCDIVNVNVDYCNYSVIEVNGIRGTKKGEMLPALHITLSRVELKNVKHLLTPLGSCTMLSCCFFSIDSAIECRVSNNSIKRSRYLTLAS